MLTTEQPFGHTVLKCKAYPAACFGQTLEHTLTYKQCEKTSKKVIGTRNNIIRMLAGSTLGASGDTHYSPPIIPGSGLLGG